MPSKKRKKEAAGLDGHQGDSFPKIAPQTDEPETFEVVSAEQVVDKKTVWLCKDFLSLGAIWLLDGGKGSGKSTIAVAIAAMVAGGPALPSGKKGYRGNVLWFAGEEELPKVKKKYSAAGGPAGTLHFPGRGPNGEVLRHLAIAEHEDMLQETVRRFKARIIVLDTLACFTGGISLNGEIEARSIMSPLTRVAQATECLVLPLRHPRKQKTDDPLLRGQGNVAVAGAARGVMTTGKDPDSGRLVFGLIRGNDSKTRPVYAYDIVDVEGVGVVEWGPLLPLSPDRIEFGVMEEAQEMLRVEAKTLLRKRIGNGWVKAKDILKEAKENGISPDQIDRARAKLGVTKRRRGKFGGEGWWEWGPPENGWPKEM